MDMYIEHRDRAKALQIQGDSLAGVSDPGQTQSV
jgi:hypothetical protein